MGGGRGYRCHARATKRTPRRRGARGWRNVRRLELGWSRTSARAKRRRPGGSMGCAPRRGVRARASPRVGLGFRSGQLEGTCQASGFEIQKGPTLRLACWQLALALPTWRSGRRARTVHAAIVLYLTDNLQPPGPERAERFTTLGNCASSWERRQHRIQAWQRLEGGGALGTQHSPYSESRQAQADSTIALQGV